MTKEEIAIREANLRKAYDAANAAENAYRVAKANKFLQLSCPTDGSKKPTEAVILSTIDADQTITALRLANQAAQAELDVQKMVFKALSMAN
jgi:hypothetical protein